MICKEPEARSFGERLAVEELRLTSPLAVWEAARGVEASRGIAFQEARIPVRDFLDAAGLQIVSIDADMLDLALDAHQHFGKGVHPAGPNFGDCFAYACTKRHDGDLLFKGNDFSQTDICDAMLT